MQVLAYDGLDTQGLEPQVARVAGLLAEGNFRAANMKKLAQGGFYRAELGRKDRLLVQLRQHQGQGVILLLEVIREHAYAKSRFLAGATVDESRIPNAEMPDPATLPALSRLPEGAQRFRLLDKVLLWDEDQEAAFRMEPPLVLIGSAGSGKTALALEKLKEQPGSILYATLSPYLAEHARGLYHANGFAREDQEVDFLDFREFLETIRVPKGREATYRDFLGFFRRHARSVPGLDAHRVFEEFRGVLTGFPVERPWLEREAYLALGVRQSIFPAEERGRIYDLFEKYRAFLSESGLFETNVLAHAYLEHCKARYDLVAADEIQDITNVQVSLLLKSLRKPGNFLLCGDSNQIVHPNFFSWAHLKTFFFERADLAAKDITALLQVNHRNTPEVTELANRLLRLKRARFGSVDRESHYLVRSATEAPGEVVCLRDSDAVRRELDTKTGRSAHFAVIVLRDEDKAEASRLFKTPLLFSIHEAKGLEYENVVLVNFTGGQRAVFSEIAADLTPADLEGEFRFSRARDKADKSLETYKFFVNSLYVAMTRAVRNLYWLEPDVDHPFLALMGFGERKDLHLAEQKSTAEEWEREARRLEQQGKQEQAEAIQRTRLVHHPVPWPVLDLAGLAEVAGKSLPPRSVSAKGRERLFEWSLLGIEPMTLAALQAHGYPAQHDAILQRDALLARITAPAKGPHCKELWRNVEAHGVSYRTAHGLTPLMLAARVGNLPLVEALLDRGADPALLDTRGWTAFHHVLDEAMHRDGPARQGFKELADLLEPESLGLEAGERLLKLDRRQGVTLLVHVFHTLLPLTFSGDPYADWPGLTAVILERGLHQLPEAYLPAYRKKRTYISSLLASHERAKETRPLFRRVQRGTYVLDPGLRVRTGEAFKDLYGLLFPEPLRPYAPSGIREFLETPDTYQPPYIRTIEPLVRKREQELADREAARQQSGLREGVGVRTIGRP